MSVYTVTYGAAGKLARMALERQRRRIDNMLLTHSVLTRTWDEYLKKPSKMPKPLWDSLEPRFTMTDLATPVLETICSATYGGDVTRRIDDAVNKKELQALVESNWYREFVPQWHVDAAAYGMGYAWPGFDETGEPTAALLSPLLVEVVTPADDVRRVLSVEVIREYTRTSYRDDGIYDGEANGEKMAVRKGSNFGFVPVAFMRGRYLDCTTPYANSLIWPAVEETKQVTFLMNDIMVLERAQSFSTLVVKGAATDTQQDKQQGWGPFAYIKLDPGTDNSDAKYISPEAEVAQINSLIESKFERCATQCQVPVDLFTRSKSGTNVATGAAFMSHKPLYDLVLKQQSQAKRSEMDLLAMFDALYSWRKAGKAQKLDVFRKRLKVDITFEHESNPAWTQERAQVLGQLLELCLITHKTAYDVANPRGSDAEQKLLEAKYTEARTMPEPVLELPG